MSTIPASSTEERLTDEVGTPRRQSRRRQTAHLKLVPETRQLREKIRAHCAQVALGLDKSSILSKDQMEALTRATLDELGLDEGYVGWTMVVLASEFWRDQVAATPPSRRLFLLPHCLKHAEGCPAEYDEFGLDCRECGACSIADYRTMAEDMGYKVLVAEGSPIVLKIIVSGYVDAIVGVACLNVLEKAIDKILLAGIPCMAVPLLSSDCRNTGVDQEWVTDMLQVSGQPVAQQTSSYVHLMRAASGLFEPSQLDQLAPRLRSPRPAAEPSAPNSSEEVLASVAKDPIAATEIIAYDFLAKGGKHARPFITLAVYDALTGGKGTQADGQQHIEQFSDSVRRTALSIETFHKASLVHDDIEDNDPYRYGEETLHHQFGIPTAINVGDYLIGLGYRLVSREAESLGGETAAEILNALAEAHLRLSEGQGAELVWRDSQDKCLTPLDALKIYALKTAPAFEAALICGAALAGQRADYAEASKLFARHLGVAFQILNDLGDWQGDDHNKLARGGDLLGGRPTVLWALAWEGLDETEQQELAALSIDQQRRPEERLARMGELFRQANVFEKASRLVDKYHDRAEQVADQIEPEALRRLFYYLIDTVLARPDEPAPQLVSPSLPIVSPTNDAPTN